jgi:arylsulfatase A-like enzyme
MDLGPTILELAGLEPPESMEARTLLPALDGGDWIPREYVYAEQQQDMILTDTAFMTMVRSRDWKLVHFLGEDEGQLFDLVNDPAEVHNLWHDPAGAERKRALLDQLREWRIQSDLQTKNWAADWR